MLLCEDILLLATDDETGKLRSVGGFAELLVAGALLTDLMLAGQVRITEPGESVRKNRVVADPDAPVPDDNLLLVTRAKLTTKTSWEASNAVNALKKNLVRLLHERLIAAEILMRDERRALGLFPYTRFPAVDDAYEAGLLASIDAVLFDGVTPDDHIAALIGLLHAGDLLIPVVDRGRGIDRRNLKRYAESLIDQYWPAQAARKAIQAAQSAAAAGAVSAGA
jgi:hypothetical protein